MFLVSVWSLCEDHLGEKDSGWPWKLHPLHTGPRLWKVRIIPSRFSCLSGWDQTSDLPRTGRRRRHVPGRESSLSCITSRGTLTYVLTIKTSRNEKSPRHLSAALWLWIWITSCFFCQTWSCCVVLFVSQSYVSLFWANYLTLCN